MKKIFSTILVLFVVTTTIGQDLSKRIAANTEAVVAIKTGNLTSLMSVKELNNNALIQMMLSGMSRGETKYSSLNDFGIDLSKTAYYAYEVGEKASYHCLSVPIANVAAFEKLTNSFGETQKIKGINAKINSYDKSILAWNKNSLFFVSSDLHDYSNDSSSYYDSDEEIVEERVYQSTEEDFNRIVYQEGDDIVEMEEVEEVEETEDIAFNVIEDVPVYPGCTGNSVEKKKCFEDNVRKHLGRTFNAAIVNQIGLSEGQRVRIVYTYKIDKQGNVSDIKVRAPHQKLKEEGIRVLKTLPKMKPGKIKGRAVNVPYAGSILLMVEKSTKKQSGKQNIAINFDRKITISFENDDKLSLNKKRVLQAFTGRKFKSLKTPSYLSAMNDKNAEAVVWIKDVNGLYGNYFKEIYGKFGGMTNMAGMLDMQKLYGKSEMVLKLFLENDQMRMSTEMTVDDRWKKMYANMFNAKVNPKFYNYVNTKDVLGYVGYAINTEAVLNEYPKLLQTMLSGVPQAKEYKEEAALIGDFFSLLLDEKAVGDLINGDMLVVLSDIETKDVSYKSYTYDDDYNRKEVTKTKKQTVPEFITMFSTKNEALFNKLLHVAQKRTGLKANNGYYMLESNNDIPINLYVTVKDGIVFATSSENGIQKIMKGSKKSGLSLKQQATISENNMSFYFNAKALMTKVPKDEISNSELEMFNYVKDNVEDMVIKVRQGNDGKFLSDFIINIPKSSKNALEYFLTFAEKAAMMM